LRFGDYAAAPACYQKRGPAMLCQTATLSDGFYELLARRISTQQRRRKSRNRAGSADSGGSYFLFLPAG
jgi:hypothetical protein